MALPQLHEKFPATLFRNRSHCVSPVTVVPDYGRALAQISLEDPEFMRTLAEQAAEELADAPAEEVIRWAVDTFGERICVTSSMTDAVTQIRSPNVSTAQRITSSAGASASSSAACSARVRMNSGSSRLICARARP